MCFEYYASSDDEGLYLECYFVQLDCSRLSLLTWLLICLWFVFILRLLIQISLGSLLVYLLFPVLLYFLASVFPWLLRIYLGSLAGSFVVWLSGSLLTQFLDSLLNCFAYLQGSLMVSLIGFLLMMYICALLLMMYLGSLLNLFLTWLVLGCFA